MTTTVLIAVHVNENRYGNQQPHAFVCELYHPCACPHLVFPPAPHLLGLVWMLKLQQEVVVPTSCGVYNVVEVYTCTVKTFAIANEKHVVVPYLA